MLKIGTAFFHENDTGAKNLTEFLETGPIS